jgi:enoyl-CoA hydratase/carnithine racemase
MRTYLSWPNGNALTPAMMRRLSETLGDFNGDLAKGIIALQAHRAFASCGCETRQRLPLAALASGVK